MKINDIIIVEREEWVVVMLTSKYATVELVSNPKVWRMLNTEPK